MSKPHTVPAAVWAAALLLTACATVPEPIRTASDGPDIAGVRQNPAAFTGKTVRWGGRVLGLTNEKEYSTLEVLAQRLQRNGRPATTVSDGS